jgi:hypothetical protein
MAAALLAQRFDKIGDHIAQICHSLPQEAQLLIRQEVLNASLSRLMSNLGVQVTMLHGLLRHTEAVAAKLCYSVPFRSCHLTSRVNSSSLNRFKASHSKHPLQLEGISAQFMHVCTMSCLPR